jgi:5-methylcytosine-specific restriction endonuclease McrA
MSNPRKPKARKPIKRSSIKRSTKRLPRVNKAAKARKLAKYRKFIQSPEWGAIRMDALQRAGFQCEHVGCQMTTTLQVHHVRYTRFGGRELPTDLKVLCKDHHEAEHAAKGVPMLWQVAS